LILFLEKSDIYEESFSKSLKNTSSDWLFPFIHLFGRFSSIETAIYLIKINFLKDLSKELSIKFGEN